MNVPNVEESYDKGGDDGHDWGDDEDKNVNVTEDDMVDWCISDLIFDCYVMFKL